MFTLMKAAIVGTCLCGALGIAMTPSTLAVDFSPDSPQVGIHEYVKDGITIDEAKQIAVSDAGLFVKDVTFTKVDTEFKDGSAKVILEFMYHGVEYDYEIDAKTGKILDSKVGPAFYE